ncbi:hypothetical protein [Pantoea agglomerans]|uniref:hypothetical protein n=1 Tax=Pantoea TaxID=53335 RepID=UPI00301CC143
MITPCFDDDFFVREAHFNLQQLNSAADILENQDGSHMLVAESITIDLEEDAMSNNNSYGQELLHALKISWPILVIVVACVFGFFQLTQSRIDSQMAEVRAQITANQKSASEDNAALRTDTNQGLDRIADKLDDIGKTLTAIQVEQATQKAKSDKAN